MQAFLVIVVVQTSHKKPNDDGQKVCLLFVKLVENFYFDFVDCCFTTCTVERAERNWQTTRKYLFIYIELVVLKVYENFITAAAPI